MAVTLSAQRRQALLLDGVVPAGIRVVEMAVQVVALLLVSRSRNDHLDQTLHKWDGSFYEQIARSGYSEGIVTDPKGRLLHGSEMAFSPLYPSLVAELHTVTRLPILASLLLLSALMGTAASVLVHLIGVELTGSRKVGWIAAGLLGAMPMAVVLQMTFAEATCVAFTAATLLFAFKGKWWSASISAVLVGLSRPSGFIIAIVIPLAALWLHRHRPEVPLRWKALIPAALVGSTGSALYWAYLWEHTGIWDAWFYVERHGWSDASSFDPSQIWDYLRVGGRHQAGGLVGNISWYVFVAFIVGSVLLVLTRQPGPITWLTLGSAAFILGSTTYWETKPRQLLVAFPIIIPLAKVLARLDGRVAGPLVAGMVCCSAWFGAYMLEVWLYVI